MQIDSTPPPAPTASKVYSLYNRSSLDFVKTPNLNVRDLVWDSVHGLFHAITLASSPQHANSLVTIDTGGAVVRVAALGAEPWTLTLSANAQFVYVGFIDGSGVKRVRTDTAAPVFDIPFPGGAARVFKIAASPVDDQTFAVIASGLAPTLSNARGLAVFDGATRRPNILFETIPLNGWPMTLELQHLLEFRSGSLIYVSASEPRGLLDVSVDAQGVAVARHRPEFYAISGHMAGSRIYSDDGRVLDIDGPVGQIGSFEDLPRDAGLMYNRRVESVAAGKVFENTAAGILAKDLHTFQTLDGIQFTGAAQTTTGNLITWGTDGLAFGGPDGVVIAHGSFAQTGGGPPTQSDLPISANSTIITITDPLTRAYDSYNVRVYEIGAIDAAVGSCGRFFVTTSRGGIRANSVLEIGSDGSIIAAGAAGSGPDHIAVAGNCEMLYVGQAGSDSIWRLRGDLTLDAVIPVDGTFRKPKFSRAAAIAPAPMRPLTIAVAKTELILTGCEADNHGLAIFDDQVERPSPYDVSINGIDSIAWGADANTLYGGNSTETSAFIVDGNGPRDPRPLFPYFHTFTSNDLYRDLRFDPSRSRLYDSFGTVFDTAGNRSIGRIQLREYTAIAISSCSAPSAAMTTNATGEKIYWVRDTMDSGFEIETYDATSLAPVSNVHVSPEEIGRSGFGVPRRVQLVGPGKLAVVTDRGYLVTVESQRLR